MISITDVRNGTTIEIDGQIFQCIEFLHVKPGKGAAFVRMKLKNIRTGSVVESTFNPNEKVGKAHLEKREYQFLYSTPDAVYTFMNNESFEQIEIPAAQLGDARNYLLENMNVEIVDWNGTIIGVEMQNMVELEVVETEPGFKGDTATGATKLAKLQTGYVVKVPLFINQGEKLKIDTRTGAYLGRA